MREALEERADREVACMADGDGDGDTMGQWERAPSAVGQVFGVRVSSRSTACTGADSPFIRCVMAP